MLCPKGPLAKESILRESTLPSPGILPSSFQLRREAAKAISTVEMSARYYAGNKTPSANALQAFFLACAASLASISDAILPTVTARARTSSTVATVTFSESLDTSVTPSVGAFTIGARVLSAVTVVGTTITLIGEGITAGDIITYTKPATSALRDPAGNQVASFTGALA